MPFWMPFWMPFFDSPLKMAPKKVWQVMWVATLFSVLFPNTCTFYVRKTYKCQKLLFPIRFFFKRKLKEFTNICTFYQRKTYKCAMTFFTTLEKKLNVKNLKLWTLQGIILEQRLRRLAPFWQPFGSIWVVLVIFWLHFEFVTIPFHSLWLDFDSQISERTLREQLLRRLAFFWFGEPFSWHLEAFIDITNHCRDIIL